MSSKLNICRAVLFAFLMSTLLCVQSAFAQEYLNSQKIEVKHAGKWYEATVVYQVSEQVVKVKVDLGTGRAEERSFGLRNIRALGSGSPNERYINSQPTDFRFINQRVRTWSDSTEAFEIQATLVSQIDGIVRLERTDGRTIDIESSKLSTRDRKYLTRERRGDNAVAVSDKENAEDDNPFASPSAKSKSDDRSSRTKIERVPKTTSRENSRSSSGSNRGRGTIRFAKNAKPLSTDKWNFNAAQNAVSIPPVNSQMFNVDGQSQLFGGRTGRGSFGPSGGGFGGDRGGRTRGGTGNSLHDSVPKLNSPKLAGATLSTSGTQLGIIHNDVFTKSGLVQFIDVATGQSINRSLVKGEFLACEPGSLTTACLVAVPGMQSGGDAIDNLVDNLNMPDHFNALAIKSEKTDVDHLIPVASFHQNGFKPTMAEFVNENILVTVGDQIVVIDIPTARGYFTEPLPGLKARSLSVSPDQQHIAVTMLDAVLVFDITAGKSVGAFKAKFPGKPCFSPDGKKLAIPNSHTSSIEIYDLATGEQESSIFSTGFSVAEISWPEPRFIVVGTDEIVDVKHRIPVWELKNPVQIGHEFVSVGGANYLYRYQTNGSVFALPHNDLQEQLDAMDIDQNIILDQGDAVKLTFDLPFSSGDQDSIYGKLEQQMESRGIEISRNADISLRLSVETHKQESMDVAEFGAKEDWAGNREGEQTIRFTPTTSRFDMLKNGKVVWSYTRKNQPGGSLRLENGESPQACASRLCKPTINFFKSAKFPGRFVQLKPGKLYLGASTPSVKGIVDK